MMNSPRIFRHFSIWFHAPSPQEAESWFLTISFFQGCMMGGIVGGWSDYSLPRGQWTHCWEPFMFYATYYIKNEVIFQCLLSGWSPLMPFQDPTCNLQDFKQNWNPILDPKSSIFVVQKAAAPKSGVEFCQGSIGTISGSLATSYDVWRRRARKKIWWRRVGGF